MKRPAFQFYPGDWLQDAGLRMCSTGARGLWIDMICLMHQGTPYGYLKVNLTPILPANLARMSGATLPDVEGWLTELEEAGVFSRDNTGAIYSRRMIRDETLRAARAAGGILGGNPALIGKKKAVPKVNLDANLEPTPSSSSSTSSPSKSKSEEQEHAPQAALPTKPKRPDLGHRIPDDWQLTPELEAYCRRKRPDLDPHDQAERFTLYWQTKAGKDARKTDWDKTYMTWVRSAHSNGANHHERKKPSEGLADASLRRLQTIPGFRPEDR